MGIQFNGVDNSQSTAGLLTGAGVTNATWAMWLRRDFDIDTYGTFWAAQNAAYFAFITGSTNDNLRMDSNAVDGSGDYPAWTADPGGFVAMPVGDWIYVALTKSSTTMRLYYALEGSTTLTDMGTTQSTSATPDLGGAMGFGVFPFFGASAAGSMAYMREWAAALTKTELEAEMNSAVAVRTSNLNREYRFATTPTLFEDATPNNNDIQNSFNGTGGNLTDNPTFPTPAAGHGRQPTRPRGALINATYY